MSKPSVLRITLMGAVLLSFALFRSDLDNVIAQSPNNDKIDRRVLDAISNGGSTRFMLVLKDQADLSGAANLRTKLEKTTFVYNALRAAADRSQPAVRAHLNRLGLRYRAYYVVNAFAVESATAQAIQQLAGRADVMRIEADPEFRVRLPLPSRSPTNAPVGSGGVAWGVDQINAPDVWSMGYRGRGIVYASADTGVQWDHPALKLQYRGWKPDSGWARHNYNWWDAIHSDLDGIAGNDCGFNLRRPCDDFGHGTHVMGTGIGDDRAGNQIGVAPRAKWIGCRNMENGVGRPSTYIECFQFFLAPWDLNMQNPDPSRAADVISNSWTCVLGEPPSGEGCATNSLRATVRNVRMAGIFVAVAAGNSGPECSTIGQYPDGPPSNYDAATTIGATGIDANGEYLASLSSRGPVTIDGSNRRKPDLSAPGISVYSSYPNSTYTTLSGTSMATPHVAGSVALLWQARPGLRGNVTATEQALFNTANHNLSAGGTCGGTTSSDIPNNLFGYGRVDVLAAVNSVAP